LFPLQDVPSSLPASKRMVLGAVASQDVADHHVRILKLIDK
jgi:hypothetical protein